ncbi:MAG: DUF6883 domain-containing protein [Phycisphaerae bacterium]
MPPDFTRVEIDIRKLRDYCLSPTHPRGKHKAKIFEHVLGLIVQDAPWLQHQLNTAARDPAAGFIPNETDQHGKRFTLDTLVRTPQGHSAIVRSSWIIRTGEDVLRLVSCYVR